MIELTLGTGRNPTPEQLPGAENCDVNQSAAVVACLGCQTGCHLRCRTDFVSQLEDLVANINFKLSSEQSLSIDELYAVREKPRH